MKGFFLAAPDAKVPDAKVPDAKVEANGAGETDTSDFTL